MLSAEESYNKHLATFSAIPSDKIKTPRIPRIDVMGEAEELKLAAQEDRDALVKAGCPEEFITTFDERIGAYAHASSVWENSKFAKSEAKKRWIEENDGAYNFKERLLHVLNHALRENPEELTYVKRISAGHGKRDLVMDLKDISMLGRRNIDALIAIGFDPADIDKVDALYEKLSNLLSEANMNSDKMEELKTLSYQAYTYLQEAVAEIRTNGQYIFWKDEARLNLYKSKYYQHVRKTKKSVAPDEVPTEVTTVAKVF